MPSSKWDSLPQEVAETLASAKTERVSILSSATGRPATFLFRARDGTMGVLQILDFTFTPSRKAPPESPGNAEVKLRYKLLLATPPATQPGEGEKGR